MKKMIKMSLVAAVAVAGLSTTSSAVSLSDAIAGSVLPEASAKVIHVDTSQPGMSAAYINLKTQTNVTTAQTTVAGDTITIAINDMTVSDSVPSLYATTKMIKMSDGVKMSSAAIGMSDSIKLCTQAKNDAKGSTVGIAGTLVLSGLTTTVAAGPVSDYC